MREPWAACGVSGAFPDVCVEDSLQGWPASCDIVISETYRLEGS